MTAPEVDEVHCPLLPSQPRHIHEIYHAQRPNIMSTPQPAASWPPAPSSHVPRSRSPPPLLHKLLPQLPPVATTGHVGPMHPRSAPLPKPKSPSERALPPLTDDAPCYQPWRIRLTLPALKRGPHSAPIVVDLRDGEDADDKADDDGTFDGLRPLWTSPASAETDLDLEMDEDSSGRSSRSASVTSSLLSLSPEYTRAGPLGDHAALSPDGDALDLEWECKGRSRDGDTAAPSSRARGRFHVRFCDDEDEQLSPLEYDADDAASSLFRDHDHGDGKESLEDVSHLLSLPQLESPESSTPRAEDRSNPYDMTSARGGDNADTWLLPLNHKWFGGETHPPTTESDKCSLHNITDRHFDVKWPADDRPIPSRATDITTPPPPMSPYPMLSPITQKSTLPCLSSPVPADTAARAPWSLFSPVPSPTPESPSRRRSADLPALADDVFGLRISEDHLLPSERTGDGDVGLGLEINSSSRKPDGAEFDVDPRVLAALPPGAEARKVLALQRRHRAGSLDAGAGAWHAEERERDREKARELGDMLRVKLGLECSSEASSLDNDLEHRPRTPHSSPMDHLVASMVLARQTDAARRKPSRSRSWAAPAAPAQAPSAASLAASAAESEAHAPNQGRTKTPRSPLRQMLMPDTGEWEAGWEDEEGGWTNIATLVDSPGPLSPLCLPKLDLDSI